MNEINLPSTALQAETARELLDMLSFSLEDGRIWLSGKRMMMLDVSAFGALRNELIERLGTHATRMILTRIGYLSGSSEGDLMRQRWPDDYQKYAHIGPLLRRLEGIAKIETVHRTWIPERNYFEAEYLWHHAIEDDVQIVSNGLATEPTCWMETGYATGFLSKMFDQLIIFREVECRSMGSTACRVRAKRSIDWDDVTEDLNFLGLAHEKSSGKKVSNLNARHANPIDSTDTSGSIFLAQSGTDGGDSKRPIVGKSAAIDAAKKLLHRVASTSATVLITGESGVGKELFARELHLSSNRKDGPFIAVNCAAIPETLIESELFGVERGAFTGAQVNRPGRFERASGGTLFLDEIAMLSLVAQTKLLRALQEGEIERVGGTRVLKPNVRVVAAANVNLREAVKSGSFREDLFFRLNVFPIELPPLRERRDDIPALIMYFLQKYSQLHERKVNRITPRALQLLLRHPYPGNIRELERIIERSVILTNNDLVDLIHVQNPGESDIDHGLLFLNESGKLDPGANKGMSGSAHELDTSLDALAAAVVARCTAGQTTGAALGIEEIGNQLLDHIMRNAAERSGGNLSAAARLIGVKRHQIEYRLNRRKTSQEPL